MHAGETSSSAQGFDTHGAVAKAPDQVPVDHYAVFRARTDAMRSADPKMDVAYRETLARLGMNTAAEVLPSALEQNS